MLELRPTCEHCNKALPPDSTDARICSFEWPRPVRPAKRWKGSAWLGERPAGATVKHKPVDLSEHERFAAKLKGISPQER